MRERILRCTPNIGPGLLAPHKGMLWESQQDLAQDLAFFSLRNHGDRVRSTPVVDLISRFLLDAKSRYCVRACVFSFYGSMDGPLAMALIKNGEISGDARLLVSEILQHLAAMETLHFFSILWHLLRIRC